MEGKERLDGVLVDAMAFEVGRNVGRGEAFGEPDQANVQVGVEIFAETVEEATNENQAILDQMKVLGG